jgi:hypothetical protein
MTAAGGGRVLSADHAPQTPQAPSEDVSAATRPSRVFAGCAPSLGHGPRASTPSGPQLLRQVGAAVLSAGVSRHRGLPPHWRANGCAGVSRKEGDLAATAGIGSLSLARCCSGACTPRQWHRRTPAPGHETCDGQARVALGVGASAPLARQRGVRPRWRDTAAEAPRTDSAQGLRPRRSRRARTATRRTCLAGQRRLSGGWRRTRPRTEPAESEVVSADRTRPPQAAGPGSEIRRQDPPATKPRAHGASSADSTRPTANCGPAERRATGPH